MVVAELDGAESEVVTFTTFILSLESFESIIKTQSLSHDSTLLSEQALDLVPLITNTVLEEHQLIVGIVVVADPGTVPINSRGEKQRMHLRDGFLADQLDPIYVAYNM